MAVKSMVASDKTDVLSEAEPLVEPLPLPLPLDPDPDPLEPEPPGDVDEPPLPEEEEEEVPLELGMGVFSSALLVSTRVARPTAGGEKR